MANYQIFSQAITCANAQLGYKPGGGGSGGGGKCKDKYDEDKCIKMMEAGKCEDKKVAKKCMKTCGECDDDDGGEGGKCKDKMDKKKCKKIMEAGKCEDEKMAKKCMKTCDMCEDMGPKKSNIPNLDRFNILFSFTYWAQKFLIHISKLGVSNKNFSITYVTICTN